MQEAKRRGVRIGLVQEPYVGAVGRLKTYTGTRVVQCASTYTPTAKPTKAVVIAFDDEIQVTADPTLTTENIACAILSTHKWKLAVLSVYFEDTEPLEPYLNHVKKVISAYRDVRHIIVGGDVNAWSPWWGSRVENSRGSELASFLDEMNLHILNVGDTPTFQVVRKGKLRQSRVDITCCNSNLLTRVEDWEVDEKVTSSDHNAILYNIIFDKPNKEIKNKTTRIYNTKKAKWTEFDTVLLEKWERLKISPSEIKTIENREELEEAVGIYIESITDACEQTIPKLKTNHKFKLPWWTQELDKLKRSMMTMKRRIRCAAQTRRQHVINEYLEAKKTYEQEAKTQQTKSWKEFCSAQKRESMWDGVYRVIKRTAKRHEDVLLIKDGKALDPEDSAKLLTDTFFPEDRREEDSESHKRVRMQADQTPDHWSKTNDPPFTVRELKSAIESFHPKKAPGPDGLTADICARAIGINVWLFLEIANRCLELCYFPKPWKVAAIVVLRKPGKEDYTQAKSYRPIGLLSILGKTLEKMMVKRLRWHLLPRCNPRQYGFVPQRCTEDSLYDLVNYIRRVVKQKKIAILISLDIEGAFDSAWWPAIRTQLGEKGTPANIRKMVNSYLTDRRIRITYAGATCEKETTKGCVQGSIGGPTFWNILLDPLLDRLDQENTYCQAFADDVALVFSGSCALEIQNRANNTLQTIYEWGVQNKLRFAPHKTNAMILTNKRNYDCPTLEMGGMPINLVKEIKILGLTIDHKLTFNTHVMNVSKKGINLYKQLARVAKISWGLNPDIIRTIYVAVIEPIILYAASVWVKEASKVITRKKLNSLQRGFAQKIIKSYRTVSLNAALALSGLLPLDMRVEEAAKIYEAKRGKPLDEYVADRSLEIRESFLSACHPAKSPEIEFENIEEWNENTIRENNIEGLLAFTDGSKIEGKVGAAISYWKDGRETAKKKLSLQSYCTVFQAELYALYITIQKAMDMAEDKITVFSDSRSSLELIRSDTFHPLAHPIRRNIARLRASGKELRLFWVKAHVGVEGNERADELAKEAALKSKTAANYDKCPISYIKRQVRERTLIKWQERYLTTATASTTKHFFPTIKFAHKITKKTKLTPVQVQAFTGHGGFAQYLHRFHLKTSPECQCEPTKEETPIHLITECPKYALKRYNLEQEYQRNIRVENLPEWLEDTESRNAFLKFVTLVTNEAILRNKD